MTRSAGHPSFIIVYRARRVNNDAGRTGFQQTAVRQRIRNVTCNFNGPVRPRNPSEIERFITRARAPFVRGGFVVVNTTTRNATATSFRHIRWCMIRPCFLMLDNCSRINRVRSFRFQLYSCDISFLILHRRPDKFLIAVRVDRRKRLFFKNFSFA